MQQIFSLFQEINISSQLLDLFGVTLWRKTADRQNVSFNSGGGLNKYVYCPLPFWKILSSWCCFFTWIEVFDKGLLLSRITRRFFINIGEQEKELKSINFIKYLQTAISRLLTHCQVTLFHWKVKPLQNEAIPKWCSFYRQLFPIHISWEFKQSNFSFGKVKFHSVLGRLKFYLKMHVDVWDTERSI